jgi:hypothetical protein
MSVDEIFAVADRRVSAIAFTMFKVTVYCVAVAVAMVLSSACDPGFDIRGDVVDEQGQPVVGVRACIVCDGNGQFCTEPTSDDGLLRGSGIGWRSNGCAFEVSIDERVVETRVLKVACTKYYNRWPGDGSSSRCVGVDAHVELAASTLRRVKRQPETLPRAAQSPYASDRRDAAVAPSPPE